MKIRLELLELRAMLNFATSSIYQRELLLLGILKLSSKNVGSPLEL